MIDLFLSNLDIIVFFIMLIVLLSYLFHKDERWIFSNNKVDLRRIFQLLFLSGSFGGVILAVVSLIILCLDGSWPSFISLGRVSLYIIILSAFSISFIASEIYSFVTEMLSKGGPEK